MKKRYQIYCERYAGVMFQTFRRSFTSLDDAIDFIESTAIGDDYIITELNYVALWELNFGKSKFVCNFNPETEEYYGEEVYDEAIYNQTITMPKRANFVVKSRLKSLEDLAKEALDTHTYLDTKRLRRELRKHFPERIGEGRWEFDYEKEADMCEAIKEIVIELQDKPRRNRRSTKANASNQAIRKTKGKRTYSTRRSKRN